MPGTDSGYIASRRLSGDAKNHVELYLAATDEEKAAALDAAIEYEDSDPTAVRQTKGTGMEAQETTPLAPVDELIEIGTRMKKDKARLLELCRRIGGGPEAGIEAAEPKRRGGRRKVNKVNQVNKVPTADGAIKTGGKEKLPGDAQYWKKVTCPVCHEEKGSRVHEGLRYPILHKNAETCVPCKGSFQEVGDG